MAVAESFHAPSQHPHPQFTPGAREVEKLKSSVENFLLTNKISSQFLLMTIRDDFC